MSSPAPAGCKLSVCTLSFPPLDIRLSSLHMETFPALGINPEHRGHDGRVHFVTVAKKYNLDEYAIKRIVGHAIKDLTERVYTKRSVDWLVQEIDKIV